MDTLLQTQKSRAVWTPSFTPARTGLLQRRCACGGTTGPDGECAACRKKRESTLQHAAISSPPVGEVPPIVHDVLRSPGQSLDAGTRRFMEPRFGYDFSEVRVHADAKAADSARAVNALAYTAGRNVVFGAGQYASGTSAGHKLIAHELAHVVQQRGVQARGASPDGLEQQACATAQAIVAGQSVRPVSGTATASQLQRADDEGSVHPGGQPTPKEYIDQHTSWTRDLKEEALASDLYLLAWGSSSHYDFVLRVFAALDAENQVEVGVAFFEQLGGDTWIKEMALNEQGRTFLTVVAGYLPKNHRQHRQVIKIVLAGPQEEREKERTESNKALEKKGGTVDISLYTSYKGMDTAEALLEPIAKKREKAKETDAAFPMEAFEDIGAYLEGVAQQTGQTDFVRELHLMGHGTVDKFGFGRYFYNSETLKRYRDGLHASYMAEGATIYMDGCAMAKGDAGKKYLNQIGRIFFGEKKSGYIKGNTCTIFFNIIDLTECEPRTLRWPGDFK